MLAISTIRAAALGIAGFIALGIVSAFISANVRRLAAAKGWDEYLLRVWNSFPSWARRMATGWAPLRQLWWLWLFLGLSSGLGISLTIIGQPSHLTSQGTTVLPSAPSQRQTVLAGMPSIAVGGPVNSDFDQERPLGFAWGDPETYFQPGGWGPGHTLLIYAFNLTGKNFGVGEVRIDSAFLVSRIDGTRLPMKIYAIPDGWIDLKEAGPVPAGAIVGLQARFGLSEADFLKTWRACFIDIKAGDQQITYELTEERIRAWIERNHPELSPHVTRRK